MLNSHFFCISCSDARRNVSEVATDIAFLIDFFLSEESFGGQTDLLLFSDIANNKNRVCVVAADNFIELDVVASDLRS